MAFSLLIVSALKCNKLYIIYSYRVHASTFVIWNILIAMICIFLKNFYFDRKLLQGYWYSVLFLHSFLTHFNKLIFIWLRVFEERFDYNLRKYLEEEWDEE